MSPLDITHRLVAESDIPRAYELETAGYPEDEAASLESLKYRQRVAPELFLGAFAEQQLQGFITATRTVSGTLTHESMETHEARGGYVAIHSVCVAESVRRRGVALGLLREYVRRLREAREEEKVKGLRLVAHEELVGLYERAGFEMVGRSELQHGSRPWFEMKLDL